MKIFYAAILLSLFNIAQAEEFIGKVITVLDGDTLQVLRSGHPVKIRLAGIDAPESAQEYGDLSRQSLAQLVLHKPVHIHTLAVDDYGRLVAEVTLDGLNINHEQVRRGMAWAYSFFHNDKTVNALEQAARAAKRGLWAQANPIVPNQWRHAHAQPSPKIAQNSGCGSKRYCAQMNSCLEAKFYLKHCGIKSLDGDADGVPCESLCIAEK